MLSSEAFCSFICKRLFLLNSWDSFKKTPCNNYTHKLTSFPSENEICDTFRIQSLIIALCAVPVALWHPLLVTGICVPFGIFCFVLFCFPG